MIAEAIDTLYTLGWAFAVWIVLCAMFATAALYAVVVTVWAATRAAVRATKAACARLSWRQAASEAPEVDGEGRAAPDASGARTDDSAPSWAHTDTKEAA